MPVAAPGGAPASRGIPRRPSCSPVARHLQSTLIHSERCSAVGSSGWAHTLCKCLNVKDICIRLICALLALRQPDGPGEAALPGIQPEAECSWQTTHEGEPLSRWCFVGIHRQRRMSLQLGGRSSPKQVQQAQRASKECTRSCSLSRSRSTARSARFSAEVRVLCCHAGSEGERESAVMQCMRGCAPEPAGHRW